MARPPPAGAAARALLVAAAGLACAAAWPQAGGSSLVMQGWRLSSSLVVQLEAQHGEVPDSPVNPGNRMARLAQAVGALELRPALRLDSEGGAVRVSVSPRVRERRERIDTAGLRETTSTTDAWVQAWGLRVLPSDELSLMVGREVLQWGPSASLSPSNPIYTDNGRSSPYAELGGTDLAQVQWFPAQGITLSAIDNFGAGRLAPAPTETFRRMRLLKLDVAGASSAGSVHVAWPDGQPRRVGFHLRTTASDALLLYAEGGYALRSTQRVAQADEAGGSGTSLAWRNPARHRLSGLTLLGAAYTLAAGPTVNVEWIHNSQGWNDAEAAAAGALVQQAGDRLLGGAAGGAGTALALQQLGVAAQPGSLLLRRNYAFVQYHHPQLFAELDLTLRATHGLDDSSNRFSLTCETPLGRRYLLFCQVLWNTGGSGREFGRYLERQVLVGARASW